MLWPVSKVKKNESTWLKVMRLYFMIKFCTLNWGHNSRIIKEQNNWLFSKNFIKCMLWPVSKSSEKIFSDIVLLGTEDHSK